VSPAAFDAERAMRLAFETFDIERAPCSA